MDARDLPVPPFELASRVGTLEGQQDPEGFYDALGRRALEDIRSILPDGWEFEGRRVLDFGCGAGRTLRHLVGEAERAEIWGSDIDEPSIAWLKENLCPPLHVTVNGEAPPIDLPDGHFDLIYCVSVFTHLTDHWADWLLELRRLLKDDGLLCVTFMGEGQSEVIAAEPWVEDRVGMLVLNYAASWDIGGPMVLHSPWWIRAHWGRAFDILELRPHGFIQEPGRGHGLVLMRKRAGDVTREDLLAPERDEPRELTALQHAHDRLIGEIGWLRPLADRCSAAEAAASEAAAADDGRRELEAAVADLERKYEVAMASKSWQLTAPFRAAAEAVRRARSR